MVYLATTIKIYIVKALYVLLFNYPIMSSDSNVNIQI